MYWDNVILSQIGAGIGVYIKADKAILDRYYSHFARIPIDIDLDKLILDTIMIGRIGILFSFFVHLNMRICPFSVPIALVLDSLVVIGIIMGLRISLIMMIEVIGRVILGLGK